MMLRNVLPSASGRDVPCVRLGHSKTPCDFTGRYAFLVESPDLTHVAHRESRPWQGLAHALRLLTALPRFSGVLGVRSDAEVGGVDASLVVAGMEDMQPLGNSTNSQCVGDPVGRLHGSIPELAVASAMDAALPFPTVVFAPPLNLRPKPIFDARARNCSGAEPVAIDVPEWDARYLPLRAVVLGGDAGPPPTPALTESDWNSHAPPMVSVFAGNTPKGAESVPGPMFAWDRFRLDVLRLLHPDPDPQVATPAPDAPPLDLAA